MGLRATPRFDVRKHLDTGMWEIALVLGAKMRKADAQVILKQMEGNLNAQAVLDRLNEGIIGRRY